MSLASRINRPIRSRILGWRIESLTSTSWYLRNGHGWLDRVLLLLLLPPAIPLMLLIACVNTVVFRSPRKVFFLQERIGYRCRSFQIYKFRTMSEAPLSSLRSWADGSDRLRVTRFGKFLRNTHLDELPQLFNILRGEMSFIGPRPEMVEVESWAMEQVPGFEMRLAIRPGVAGLAQITQGYTGRSVAAYSEKLAINLDYIERMSLGLDLQIVLRTIIWMLRGRGWSWSQPVERSDEQELTVEVGAVAKTANPQSEASAVGETRAERARISVGS